MISLPWNGIPLGWRLASIRGEHSVQSENGLNTWRAATGLEDTEPWLQRLAVAGTVEASFAAALIPDSTKSLPLSQMDDDNFAAAYHDLQCLVRCARSRARVQRFLLDLIEDLLRENAMRDQCLGDHGKQETGELEILAVGIRDVLLARFGEIIEAEFRAMQAAGIIDGEVVPSSPEGMLLAILQVQGSVEYLLEEYPTLPFHLHSFIRYCTKISTPFFPRSGRPSRISLVRRAMARDGESLADIRLGTRFDAIGGDQTLELRSDKGTNWRQVDQEVANIRWFLAMVKWLEARGIDLGARHYALLEDQEGGWLRIPAEEHPPNSTYTLTTLFEFGALTALFYVAGSHHMTQEAVIILGNHPVVNRMDTLFSNGPLQIKDPRAESYSDPTHSVMNSLLLPRWRCEYSGKLLSGSMGLLQRILPKGQPVVAEGSDPHSVAGYVETEQQLLLPGKRALEAIVEGFEKCYFCILNGREELLGSDWFCSKASGITGRVILQDGWRYGVLGEKIHSRAFLTDAMRTDSMLEALWYGLGNKTPAAVVQYEIDSLWKGLCPQYWSSYNGTALFDEDGRVLVDDYFKYGITERIKKRMRSLSPADAKRQVCHIVQSCAVFSSRPGFQPVDWNNFWRAKGILTADTDRPGVPTGMAAQQARDVLVASAPARGEENWIGVSQDSDGNWQIGGIPHGLASGLDGIGLFLLYFHWVTNDQESGNVAGSILRSAANRLSQGLERDGSFSAGSPLLDLLISCSLLLAHSVRCGVRPDNAVSLLRKFWTSLEANIGTSSSSVDAINLTSKLRFLTEILACSPHESARAVLSEIASQLAFRLSESLDSTGWEEWYPNCYTVLRNAEPLVQDPMLLETALELEARLLDQLDTLIAEVDRPRSPFKWDVNMATAQDIITGIFSTDSALQPRLFDRLRRGFVWYLEQSRELHTVETSKEILRHFCLLDAVVRREPWEQLLPALKAEYQDVLSVLNETPCRPAVKGTPVPFLGLAGGMAGVGFASLRGSHNSDIPFPWFVL